MKRMFKRSMKKVRKNTQNQMRRSNLIRLLKAAKETGLKKAATQKSKTNKNNPPKNPQNTGNLLKGKYCR